jgi:hypothetical protein
VDGAVRSDYGPPDIVVVDDDVVTDAFAWLHAYAPFVNPLSQFARVMTYSDWRRADSALTVQAEPVRSDKWACLLLGEALAQGPPDADLGEVPLSRAAACFSLPIARAAARYGRETWGRDCLDRLMIMEQDDRFAGRNVTVGDLAHMWRLLGDMSDRHLSVIEAAGAVLEAVMPKHAPVQQSLTDWAPDGAVGSSPLLDDSIEERVRAFNDVAESLLQAKEPASLYMDVRIAVAAFLVGRGSSHAFLLRRAGRRFPTAQAWFGLLLALTGPSTWDPEWSRVVKSLERQVRGYGSWGDIGGVDLFWAEFEWISRTWSGLDGYLDLPRHQLSSLTVELLPGVACQMRLDLPILAPEPVQEAGDRDRVLHDYVTQFVELALRARNALEEPPRARGRRPGTRGAAGRGSRPKRAGDG